MPKWDFKKSHEKGKVLSFEQDGEFFFRRGMNKQDRGNLMDALTSYRQAYDMEPDNPEYRLAVAETLTEMCRFSESNALLLTMPAQQQKEYEECYFGMACNFVGLQDYERARECLDKYMYYAEDGEFVDDVYDMLDMILDWEDGELDDEDGEYSHIRYGGNDESAELAAKGKGLLELGDYKGAIELLTDAVRRYPELNYMRNNLALAYFCDKDYKSAIRNVEDIIRRSPGDVQAHCNLALFSRAAGDEGAVQREAEYIGSLETDDFEELSRISITLMELDRQDQALPILKSAYDVMPYDADTVHRLAMCYYSQDEFAEAALLYDKLRKLDPHDTVARFYLDVCRESQQTGQKRKGLMYGYQVPYDEMMKRMQTLNAYAALTYDELKAKWENDESFYELVCWALGLTDPSIKRAMLDLVTSFGDGKAQQLVREFAIRGDQPDELKQETFGMLKRMGAEEPYIGYIGGNLVQSAVTGSVNIDGELPASYVDMLARCIQSLKDGESQEYLACAVFIWERYVRGEKRLTALTDKQVMAYSGALEYMVRIQQGDKITKHEIMEKYELTYQRLNTALEHMLSALENSANERET